MKNILQFLLIFISNLSAQSYYTFSELKGIEDQSGNTHLFYRLESSAIGSSENSVYHLDLFNDSDTLFLFSGSTMTEETGISDFEFWNNNPQEYIYCGGTLVLQEAFSFIRRFDSGFSSRTVPGWASNIEISPFNDSLLYAYDTSLVVSTDGGRSFTPVGSSGSPEALLSLSPSDSGLIFVHGFNHSLYRSTNGGADRFLLQTADPC